MGWKDSGDSVVYPDGSLVKGPKALCELQGYVYNAWQRMAEITDELGRAGRAEELSTKVKALFKKFNEGSWDEESGFYAYALDGEKNKVLTVASNRELRSKAAPVGLNCTLTMPTSTGWRNAALWLFALK